MPDGFNGFPNFFFSNPVPVTPGVIYYFDDVVDSGDVAWLGTFPPSGYPGGTGFFHGQPAPFTDLWFREGVLAPQPSTAWLILLGAGCLAWHRRRNC